MEYRSVRPPKTMESAEEFDEAAREGRILDRIGLLEIMVRTIDELFRMFLKTRLSKGWEGEKDRIRGWIRAT